ncbi:MAG: MFS domain-containing histidine kinase [Chloroflexota bacterium]|nr:MFS domain-containing histidine kinase [Chloroflexota bacterium]
MRLLRFDRRAAAGALVGIVGSVGSVALAGIAGQSSPYIVLMVLTVALVGLGLGAAASFYAYIAASIVLVAFSTESVASTGSLLNQLVRFGTFAIGSPLVVLLAIMADHERQAIRASRDLSAASEQRLADERQAADEARRQVDAALRDAEQDRARLGEVAEAIPEPLIVYGADAGATYANRAALRLFGRSFVERPLAEWGRTTDPRDEQGTPIAEPDYPQLAAQQAPLRRRMMVRLPMSGRDLLVDVEGTPIPGGGAVLLLRDVGKEEDERRRLSRFASFVAHELRNPLAVARARIELAGRETGLPDRAAAHGQRALESVEAAIAILERLEMYSRADSGVVEAEREPFDPRPAVVAAIERLRARGSEREVTVHSNGRARPRALGDRRLAEQAITNLLTNADRYSEPNRPISVTVEGGDQVVVRVADQGPGIADTVAERLFLDRVVAGRGLGLGLYLVRAMMDAQGGSVQLEQRRPAAIFALRWPRARDRASTNSGSRPPERAALH